MKKGRYDRVLDLIQARTQRVDAKFALESKNEQPFDTVPVKPSERIANYLTTPPEVQEQLKQSFGADYDKYANNMESLMEKYKGGGDNA